MNLIRTLALAAMFGLTLPLLAQTNQKSEGEVRRIDKSTNKITIRHGELKNLDMPPMTMVFQVRDPALLDKLKPGDKIVFVAEKEGSVYLVTHIEPR